MRIEANVGFACQCSCAGCDRLCGVIPPNPADDMTPDQISAMLLEAKTRGLHIERAKVLGGEPLLNPNIVGIIEAFIRDGIEQGIVESVKLDTNGIAPLPADFPKHPQVRISGRKPKKKIHIPYLWSPTDLGLKWHGPCSHPWRCGFSIDSRGWLPCSPAIMIDRLFYGGKHYRQSIPTEPWDVSSLCCHCLYAAPAAFREANAKPISQFTPEMKSPTRSWAAALRGAGVQVAGVYNPRVP